MFEVAFRADVGERGKLFIDEQRMRRLTQLQPAVICITREGTEGRRAIETLIERTYAQSYGSKITGHYPALMSVHDAAGAVLAAVGFRAAGPKPLYLEQYLAKPVEACLGEGVDRTKVVEIGNLASAGKGASLYLFVALAAFLHRQGFTHAVATATEKLQKTFAFLGFDIVTLAAADSQALADRGASWGSYYTHNPRVVASAISPSCVRLERYLPREHNADLASILFLDESPIQ